MSAVDPPVKVGYEDESAPPQATCPGAAVDKKLIASGASALVTINSTPIRGTGGAYIVCESFELPDVGSRARVQLPSESDDKKVRQVLVIRNSKDTVVAIDSKCYHADGNLELGDIEDFQGRRCIVCPMHYYRLDLKTGESIKPVGRADIEVAGDGDAEWTNENEEWKCVGRAQRTHEAWEKDGSVFVKVSRSPKFVLSDNYAEVAKTEKVEVEIDEEPPEDDGYFEEGRLGGAWCDSD